MDKLERNLEQSQIEIRENDDGKRTITGYAVKWDMRSVKMGYWKRFQEVFKRGAFTDTLKNDNQKALWSHDTSQVLGSTKNNTLRLSEDSVGLRFELDLPSTQLGNDAYELVKRGDVDGVSFGFSMQGESWDEADPDNIIRSVTKAKLMEISPVAFPAYPDSQVSARSYDPYKKHKELNDKRKKILLRTYL